MAKECLEKMKEYHRLRRSAPSSAPKQYECRLVNKYGDVRDAALTVDLIQETKRSVASIEDITQRKRAEEEIRKFKTIADKANYGISITSLEGKFLYVNEAFCQMHGYTAGNCLVNIYPSSTMRSNWHQ